MPPTAAEGPGPSAPPRLASAARAALRRLLVAVLGLALGFLLLDLLFPFPWKALERPPARIVIDREGRPLRVFLAPDDRIRFPTRLERLPPRLVEIVLQLEDRRFRRHPGIDPVALARATLSNLRAGKVVSGASTLTMQVARMAEPRPRTFRSKAIEAFRALQLELHRSKDEILESYLYLAPYGGNVEGIEAASRIYFGTAAAGLSVAEMALLAVVPRAPNAYHPLRHPGAARRVRARALELLVRRGVLTASTAAEAGARPLPVGPPSMLFEAPHFARFAARSHPDAPEIRTTLDLDLQRIAERQVAGRLLELRDRGVENVAAVVLDNETRGARAWVGSAGFFEAERQGQVDGVLAPRSPGSALKPFLYALAFDRGQLLPRSWLLDVPTDFSGYEAENYDGEHRGRIEAAEALALSLNVPAVRLLSRVGLPDFLELLRRGGLSTLAEDPARYGLPLVLGGGEVRLVDLTNLYASLARQGRYRRWRILDEGPSEEGAPLLGREAVWQVGRILSRPERPDLPGSWRLSPDAPAVSWKTGTSWGHRDAWSVGYSARFTIGVWVGSFSGRPLHGMSGARDATPLLFDLFRALDPGGLSAVDRRRLPPTAELCALSRQLPTPSCPRLVTLEVAADRLLVGSCSLHRRLLVDELTGLRLSPDCLADHQVASRTLALDPPELAAFLASGGQSYRSLPPFAPDCVGLSSEEPPRIVAPEDGSIVVVQTGLPLALQGIGLQARSASDTRRLFWYQDGRLVAVGAPDEALFVSPEPGRHRLVVVDQAGRLGAVSYRVERP